MLCVSDACLLLLILITAALLMSEKKWLPCMCVRFFFPTFLKHRSKHSKPDTREGEGSTKGETQRLLGLLTKMVKPLAKAAQTRNLCRVYS